MFGERSRQRDFCIDEWPNLGSTEVDDTLYPAIAKDRQAEQRAEASQFLGDRLIVLGVRQHVLDLDRLAAQQDAPGHAVPTGSVGMIAFIGDCVGSLTDSCYHPIDVVLAEIDRSELCLAQARGTRDDRLENALEIEGRPADHLEDLGQGGLASQVLVLELFNSRIDHLAAQLAGPTTSKAGTGREIPFKVSSPTGSAAIDPSTAAMVR